ncbi:AraC family transcriptional regulator [Rubrivivax gelatinosus]|uniref:Transcriptional regulator, AraC family n=2 Tax=Rubrivivax gelatinosus TaxID=28068 RepID=I0HTV5_RUBGI|nr:AraC family transcriptional regulator [Rubrivivax gelatinosus]BAL96442.1 transcriptional regulator, AraC family [Rubrivivax gelatinosus IL144]
MDAPAVLACWRSHAVEAVDATVLPDGCRDLILSCPNGARPAWFVSDLPTGAYTVRSEVGDRFVGFRLRPSARIAEAPLLAALRARPERDEAEALALIAEHVRLDARLDEALQALATAGGVLPARRQLGVGERTLERLLHTATGRPPRYWHGLARARRAARALATAEPLADLAAQHGYADQAHLTRELRAWFGQTPAALRRRADLLALLAEPAYA